MTVGISEGILRFGHESAIENHNVRFSRKKVVITPMAAEISEGILRFGHESAIENHHFRFSRKKVVEAPKNKIFSHFFFKVVRPNTDILEAALLLEINN